MKTMSQTVLRQNLYESIKEVERGRKICISRRGKDVAELVPVSKGRRSNKPVIPADFYVTFCSKHGLTKLYLFGSILTDEFDDESDVDIMYQPREPLSFHAIMNMTAELEEVFGRRVDFVDREAVELHHSPTRRKNILDGARVVYEA